MKLLTTKIPEYLSVRFIIEDFTGCWIWQETLNKKGYPTNIRYLGTMESPQRRLYKRLIGKIPKDFVVDHKECKNHACVNPYHLEAVTNTENIRRGRVAKLTLEKAIEIKRLYATRKYKQRELAVMFGVGRSTIAMVTCSENWKDSGGAVWKNNT